MLFLCLGDAVALCLHFHFVPGFKKKNIFPREMSQQLRILVVLPDDPRSVPSTHIRWPIAIYNHHSQGSNDIFWHPHIWYTQAYIHK